MIREDCCTFLVDVVALEGRASGLSKQGKSHDVGGKLLSLLLSSLSATAASTDYHH
jgi:hypothetical protein